MHLIDLAPPAFSVVLVVLGAACSEQSSSPSPSPSTSGGPSREFPPQCAIPDGTYLSASVRTAGDSEKCKSAQATVELTDNGTGEPVTYQIVGDDEADLKHGKISVSSPIARALIGKVEGETAEVQAPGGVREYEILAVHYR